MLTGACSPNLSCGKTRGEVTRLASTLPLQYSLDTKDTLNDSPFNMNTPRTSSRKSSTMTETITAPVEHSTSTDHSGKPIVIENAPKRSSGAGGAKLTNKATIVGICVLFFSLVVVFIPFVWSKSLTFWTFIASFTFFNALIPVTSAFLRNFKFYRELVPKKQLEVMNRAISIVFNLSVTLHTYDLYLGLGILGLPSLEALFQGESWVLNFFTGWSIGYVLYDFLWLISIFGETSVAILLHHCCEMLILTAYIYEPPVGGIYTMSGAVMMISSAMLHVQRISFLCKVSPTSLKIIKYVLLFFWISGRLVATPHLMTLAFFRLPFTALHAALLLSGSALMAMNGVWAFKIARKADLAF